MSRETFAAFFEALDSVVRYITYSGQRRKPKGGVLSQNRETVIAQRIYVLTHILKPGVFNFKSYAEIGALFGVRKGMIMRHMKDFNVAFGVYGTNQKRVSAHEGGTYVEAGFRGHETRRRRQQERRKLNGANSARF